MSVKTDVINNVFGGNNDPFTNIILQEDSATDPDSAALTGVKGTFLVMVYDGNAVDQDIWLNTGTIDRTTWTQIHDETA